MQILNLPFIASVAKQKLDAIKTQGQELEAFLKWIESSAQTPILEIPQQYENLARELCKAPLSNNPSPKSNQVELVEHKKQVDPDSISVALKKALLETGFAETRTGSDKKTRSVDSTVTYRTMKSLFEFLELPLSKKRPELLSAHKKTFEFIDKGQTFYYRYRNYLHLSSSAQNSNSRHKSLKELLSMENDSLKDLLNSSLEFWNPQSRSSANTEIRAIFKASKQEKIVDEFKNYIKEHRYVAIYNLIKDLRAALKSTKLQMKESINKKLDLINSVSEQISFLLNLDNERL